MNITSSIQCVALIALLVFSQVGAAFASMPAMQDCGMDMSMDADVIDSMHSMKVMGDPSINDDDNDMDCCDADMMNSQATTCCDAQCQCSSFVSTLSIMNKESHGSLKLQAENVLISLFTLKHTPFLQQPKRPPIRNFS